MILAILGTHPSPMTRLEIWLEQYGDRTGERCVIQGFTATQATHVERAGIVSPESLDRLIDAAHVVITHGGPGSIFAAGARGKRPIVVPRSPQFGEHVDDHQIRFAQWLAMKRPLSVVLDTADLDQVVERHRANQGVLQEPYGPSDAVLAAIRQIFNTDTGTR